VRTVADGTHVDAGQRIAYLGDSNDMNGIHPHLHFGVHPRGKAAVSPFPFLKASHLLTVAPPRARRSP
jgi:murein DD-endopeptidase MepM/ murein hydrolase activator NlpD